MYEPRAIYVTSPNETILPVMYMIRYRNTETTKLFAEYKFVSSRNAIYWQAKNILQGYVLDIVLHAFRLTHIDTVDSQTSTYITAPPSTMFVRGEKMEDSTRELLRQYVDLYTCVFSIKRNYIHRAKAKHLGSTRSDRISHTLHRYTISPFFKLRLAFNRSTCLHFILIDDVCSTGGTLQACKETLEEYLKHRQKKKPELCWTIQVFSIAH